METKQVKSLGLMEVCAAIQIQQEHNDLLAYITRNYEAKIQQLENEIKAIKKGKEWRHKGACTLHRINHQRCPLTCKRRKSTDVEWKPHNKQ